jgi:type IV pilus assembly protein PilB
MKIGDVLINDGLITRDQLQLALAEQLKTHDRLGTIVLKNGFATPKDLAPTLAKYFDIPFIYLQDIYKDIKPEIIDIVPAEIAHRFHIIPIDLNNNTLTIATFDPLDLEAIDTLRMKTGHKVSCVVAVESEINEAVEYCYNDLPRLKTHVENFIDLEIDLHQPPQQTFEEQESDIAVGEQPVVKYVKSLIVQAVNSRVSDIHLQPKETKAELCFRVDGILHQIDPPPPAMVSAITTRIKILSGLDISEKRLPQDGRFRVKIGKNEIDIRVSSFPTIYGESVVMRLLNTSAPLLDLEQLGFEQDAYLRFKELIGRAYGMVLVTGPTGSGKTTTLYTALNAIKSDTKNIVTLEDPVEYRLPFIQQTQINPHIGFDFARGLRSILRQDPDIIMVGEIRDKETAEIAINAALTGHLVFATLHTNDAASAPVRLVNMGVEPYLITSSLLGVIAQRLIRVICPHCSTPSDLPDALRKEFGIPVGVSTIRRGMGCVKCMKSGYHGRKGIYELLVPNQVIRKYVLENRSGEEIRKAAEEAGMKTLRQASIEKLLAGLTTPEEVLRVTQETST